MSLAVSHAAASTVGLSRQHLLAVYLVTPLLLVVVVIDAGMHGGQMRNSLPQSPAMLPLYSLVFGFPHVLASFFLLGDRELARGTASVIGASLLIASIATMAALLLLDARGFALAVILTTMVHVLGQQTGLAAGQAGLSRPDVSRLTRMAARGWRVLMAAMGCAAGVAVGGESAVAATDAPHMWLLAAGLCLLASTPVAAGLAFTAYRRGADVRAMLAIQATAIVGYLLVLMGYSLLGIWLFRCVHDVTAFMVYGAVANARARTQPGGNRLYRLFGFGRAGALTGWALWPLAIGLTALAAYAVHGGVLLALTWTHYLAEHRLWRYGSAVRRWLPLR